MTKKDELFVLIKSLSRNEKRYFKVFCKTGSDDANYLKLFNAIDAQDAYDEAVIKKKFKGQAFIKQLHVTKNYLAKLVLKSLRDFHAGISKNAELKDALRNVEILFNKELYQHCAVELQRAERLATDCELHTGLVEVYGWQRRLEQQSKPNNFTGFEVLIKKQETAIAALQTSNAYWQLATNFTHSLSRGLNPQSAFSNLLDDDANAKTREEKVLHYNSLYFRYLRNGQNDKASESMHHLLEVLESDWVKLKENMGLYASSANNLISFLVFSKKYDEALAMIERARKVYAKGKPTSENKILLKQVLRTINLELEIYRDLKNFKENEAYIRETDSFITGYFNKMPKEYQLSFSFQLASVHFMLNNYSRALHWVNHVLNNRFEGHRMDIQVQVRLLNLMVHLEQQNMFVLRNFVDSARRFMNKARTVQEHEQVLLKFFSKIGQAFPHQYKGLFEELYAQLFPDDKEPLVSASTLDFIDYKSWIEGKVQKS